MLDNYTQVSRGLHKCAKNTFFAYVLYIQFPSAKLDHSYFRSFYGQLLYKMFILQFVCLQPLKIKVLLLLLEIINPKNILPCTVPVSSFLIRRYTQVTHSSLMLHTVKVFLSNLKY